MNACCYELSNQTKHTDYKTLLHKHSFARREDSDLQKYAIAM